MREKGFGNSINTRSQKDSLKISAKFKDAIIGFRFIAFVCDVRTALFLICNEGSTSARTCVMLIIFFILLNGLRFNFIIIIITIRSRPITGLILLHLNELPQTLSRVRIPKINGHGSEELTWSLLVKELKVDQILKITQIICRFYYLNISV